MSKIVSKAVNEEREFLTDTRVSLAVHSRLRISCGIAFRTEVEPTMIEEREEKRVWGKLGGNSSESGFLNKPPLTPLRLSVIQNVSSSKQR